MLLTFNQFIKYKIYIGHSYKNTKLLSSWLLYRLQNNIWILDIFKTIFFLKNVISFLKYIISYNYPIWFVNLEFMKEFLFMTYSKLCGEFFCSRYWIRGMLSNYSSVLKSIKKYALKKIAYKSSIFLKLIQTWHITRYVWPRAIFLSNIKHNYIVCKEVNSMFLPSIGIIDSNDRSFLVKFPIISNEHSIESYCFILNIISKLILLLKYKKLILWFFFYKNIVKEINFKNLLKKLYLKKKENFKNIFKPLNYYNILNINLNKIQYFYKFAGSVKNVAGKNTFLLFDFKISRRFMFYNKFLNVSMYKYNYIFKKKYINKSNIIANIRNVWSNLKSKKGPFVDKEKLNENYIILYHTFIINFTKFLRVIYNSYFFYKRKDHFLNILLVYRKSLRYKQFKFKYAYSSYFFCKKRRFYENWKKIKRKFKFSNRANNSLFINEDTYINVFIELYYAKWLIHSLNSNIF
jgi:small subunit ribosomal protein S2